MLSLSLPDKPFNSLASLGVAACMLLCPLNLQAAEPVPSSKPWALDIETVLSMRPDSIYNSAGDYSPPFFAGETLEATFKYDVSLGDHQLTTGLATAFEISHQETGEMNPPPLPGFGFFIRENELYKRDLGTETTLTSSLGFCIASAPFHNTASVAGLCGSKDNGRTFDALISGTAILPLNVDADLTLQISRARLNIGVQANSNFLGTRSRRPGINSDYAIEPWISAQWEVSPGSTLGYSLYMQVYFLEIPEPDPHDYTAVLQEDNYFRIANATFKHYEQFQTALFYRLHLNKVLPADARLPAEVHLSLGLEAVHELTHLDGSFRWPLIVTEFRTPEQPPEMETNAHAVNMPLVFWPALHFRVSVEL